MKRIVIEVVAAVMLTVATWLICQYVNGRSNKVCIDEAVAMKQLWLAQQAEIDRIHYEARLGSKDIEISEKDEQILALQAQVASDSIQHLSDVDAMRSINDYIHGKK